MRECPFCASDDVGPEEFSGDTPVWSVTCDECGAMGPISSSEKEAVEKWDDRIGD